MRLGLEKRAKREFGPENLFFLMLAWFPEVIQSTLEWARVDAKNGLEGVLARRVVDGQKVELGDRDRRVGHDEAHRESRRLHERDRQVHGRPVFPGATHCLGEHLVVGDRLGAADLVDADDLAALHRREERLRDVIHMDRLETGLAVTRYRDHRKEQAERKTGKEVVAFSEEERRLQDDVRDAGPRDERLAFTLASEIGVRRGRVSPERPHVHDPAYPGPAGRATAV